MSTDFESVKASIAEIVQLPDNDLLIIRGAWGVGKTYYWENLVKTLRQQGKLAFRNYAYISLFGANDIGAVRNQLMAATLFDKLPPTSNKWWIPEFLAQRGVLEGVSKTASELPYLKWLPISLANEAAFLLVHDAVICIDDIERKDEKLKIKEILGLAALLKEQKKCKVIFILNQDNLSDEEKKQFDSYNEKLVNWTFEFSPSPESVFEYVFPIGSSDFEFIRDRCLRLKIRNIRILKRIASYLARIEPYLRNIPEDIRLDVIRSVILFVWCEFDRESKRPTFDFIESYVSYLYDIRRPKLPGEPELNDEFNQILVGLWLRTN